MKPTRISCQVAPILLNNVGYGTASRKIGPVVSFPEDAVYGVN